MADVKDNPAELADYASISIAANASVSAAIDLSGAALVGFYTPAAFNGTAVSFQAAASPADAFVDVHSDGVLYSIPVAANKYNIVDPSMTAGIRFLKIVSNALELAPRVIQLAARPV